MADDAAAVLRALDVPAAHVAGFSMGGAIAQELALRHPELVRSLVLVSTYARPDALLRSQLEFWRWLAEAAPSERAFLEAFFTWVYTPRAHADGTVDQLVDEALAFPHQQSVEAFQAQVDACLAHDTADRLSRIIAPTLVLAGEFDIVAAATLQPIRRRGDPERALRAHARAKPTSPSRRSRTSSTPASTPSGARSTPTSETSNGRRERGARIPKLRRPEPAQDDEGGVQFDGASVVLLAQSYSGVAGSVAIAGTRKEQRRSRAAAERCTALP